MINLTIWTNYNQSARNKKAIELFVKTIMDFYKKKWATQHSKKNMINELLDSNCSLKALRVQNHVDTVNRECYKK